MAATKPKRAYRRSNVYALKKRGLDALDKRSVGYRALMDLRAQLVGDQGGPAEMSQARALITDYVIENHMLIQAMNEALLKDGMFETGTTTLRRLAVERLRYVDLTIRALGELGLERRRTRLPSLDELRAQAERADG